MQIPNMTWIDAFGGSVLFAIGWMTVAFIFYLRTDNASWVDAFWGSGIGFMAIYWWSIGEKSFVSTLLMALYVLWSFRISFYLFRRIYSTPEDARYTEFRKRWGLQFSYKLFFLYQFQALLVFVLALPLVLVVWSHKSEWNSLGFIGVAIFICGFMIESIADMQLKYFKKQFQGRGHVCDVGLWKYSRHPNYFGEILIWMGIATVVSFVPWGWLAWSSPALIAYFLLAVTGIPLTESQNLLSKGEAYRQYQSKTSKLIPWFPRKVEV